MKPRERGTDLEERCRAEEAKARQALRRLIELSALSEREIERRTVAAGLRSEVSRVLNGTLHLKLRHIVAIVEVLKIHPGEYFRLVFEPPQQPSRLFRELEAFCRPSRPVLGEDELREGITQLVRLIETLCAGDRDVDGQGAVARDDRRGR
jgi:hypothetical protein